MPVSIASEKAAELDPFLVYPGSSGSGLITPGASPVTIFLAPEFHRPGQEDNMHPALSYINDATLGDHFGYSKVAQAKKHALEEVGSRTKALFFEALLRRVVEDATIDLKHLMVGVTTWTGNYYHDLGFLASKDIR